MVLFGEEVSLYVWLIAAAAMLSMTLFGCLKPRLKKGTKPVFCGLCAVLCVVFSKLVYTVCNLSFEPEEDLALLLDVSSPSFALIGALLGGVLAAVLTGLITKERFTDIMDAAAPAAALMIALSRFAEATGVLGWGRYIEEDEAYLCFFPAAVSNSWGEWHFAVFFVEGVTALIILLVLLLRKRKEPARGTQYKLFFILYFATQVLYENLRWDTYMRWLFVRVSQLVGVIVLCLMMLYAMYVRSKLQETDRKTIREWIICFSAFAAAVVVCISLEFAADKAAWLPNWIIWILMAGMCAVFAVTCCRVILPAKPLSIKKNR